MYIYNIMYIDLYTFTRGLITLQYYIMFIVCILICACDM